VAAEQQAAPAQPAKLTKTGLRRMAKAALEELLAECVPLPRVLPYIFVLRACGWSCIQLRK